VAFAEGVALLSRVTQGCQPLRSAGNGAAAMRRVTACDRNLILQLDGQPALALLMADLGVSLEQPREALAAVRQTLVGVVQEGGDERGLQRTGSFGSDVLVRHIIGLDPAREGVAVAREMAVGDQVAFCQRHMDAARADLMRICAEIREELEPAEMALETAQALAVGELATPHPARRIAGAVYVSCAGRGGPHFGAPSAELQIVRRALGDVPLVGFFASGEVARHHVYGYTGVLTVFVAPGA
jgi:small ligand-binding sensory domain FIST